MSEHVTETETAARVTLDCGCWIETKKHDPTLRRMEVVIETAPTCLSGHVIKTWQQVVALHDPGA